ncbi:hypothetical protein Peur_044547 [Populus x canadensis]
MDFIGYFDYVTCIFQIYLWWFFMMTQFIPYSGLLEDEVVFYMVVGNFVCVYLYGQLMMLLLQDALHVLRDQILPNRSTPTIAEKNEASSSGNDNDARVNEPNRDLEVTQALRTQIEIQKLLHEQLKVPRCLLVIML